MFYYTIMSFSRVRYFIKTKLLVKQVHKSYRIEFSVSNFTVANSTTTATVDTTTTATATAPTVEATTMNCLALSYKKSFHE